MAFRESWNVMSKPWRLMEYKPEPSVPLHVLGYQGKLASFSGAFDEADEMRSEDSESEDEGIDDMKRIATTTDIEVVSVGHAFERSFELTHALATNSSVTCLMIDNDERRSEGVGPALALMDGPAPIESISLYKCEIGPGGFAALGDSLEHDTSLKSLSFGNCLIEEDDGDMELGYLSSGLAANTTLLYLHQFGNDAIMTEDADALAAALRSNSTLEGLSVCVQTEAGMRKLIEGLADNKGLRNIELTLSLPAFPKVSTMEIIKRMYGVLASALERNTTCLGAVLDADGFGHRKQPCPPEVAALLTRNRNIVMRWSRCRSLICWRRSLEMCGGKKAV